MDFLTSLYNGISGVNAMSHRLNVTANNVANVNTSAFKSGMASFADRLDTTLGSVSVGRGVQLGSINTSFATGTLDKTGRSTDMAISGAGFFMLRDPVATTPRYTRDGEFDLISIPGAEPDTYNLTSSIGQFVQGYNFSSTTVPSTTVSDILVKQTSPQSPTTQVSLAVNLQDNPALRENTSTSLFSSWDGRNISAPIDAANYEYSTSIKIFGSDPGGAASTSSLSDYLNIYFDSTTNPNEKEFLVTCQPSLDQRLINGSTSRYNSVTDKGAGALLYGMLRFTPNGEINDIECWNVPPNGDITPDATSKLTLPRGESYFSFDYNFGGTATNDSSTINFGSTPQPRSIASPTSAFTSSNGATSINASTTWESVFDSLGNQVKVGDTIRFQGQSGDGVQRDYTYTVNPSQSVENLLKGLQNQFACKATIINGRLTLTDNEIGTSQLAINSITYTNATGATPTTATGIAQIFGSQSASFPLVEESRYDSSSLATTNYASQSATIYQSQDGSGRGSLEKIRLDGQGTIFGQYSNGKEIKQAQVVLANFNNLQGLRIEGGNTFSATPESGLAIIGNPGTRGLGGISNNNLEMSNVDLGREMTNLVITQRAFQANSKSITTADEIYQDLLRLLRR